MKRKIFHLLVAAAFLFFASGCSNPAANVPTEKSSSVESKNVSQYIQNEPNLFKKDAGNYTITFKGARYPSAEWAKTHTDHNVIFLDYVYSNIDYQKADGTTLYIPHDAFIVTDQNGVILNSSYMFDESRKPLTTPPGTTCEASLPYIINSDVTEINVKFLNGTTGEVVGEITMPVIQPN